MSTEPQGSPTIRCRVRFRRVHRGRKQVRETESKPSPKKVEQVPRISRLMALAIVFDDLVREGKIENYAKLARLGQVSRARISQIMTLLNLAPDIQEVVLSGMVAAREPVLFRVATVMAWENQRRRLAGGST